MSSLPVLVNVARPSGEVDAVRLADDVLAAGLSGLGFADSPRLFPDPLVETARVLGADDRLLAGPCVLSLPLMHVAKASNALSTLAFHHPGRVVAVVGRGESSLANEGLRPPRVEEYAHLLASLHSLLPDEGHDMELLGAASGPRSIEVTSRELGGVLLDVGTSAIAVRAAAVHAERANPSVSVWAFLRVSVATDATQAMEASTPLLGSCASRMVAAPQWYGVSPATSPALSALAASYDYRRHGTTEAMAPFASSTLSTTAREEAARLVRDRFVLAASAEVIAERLKELAQTGIRGIFLAGGLSGVIDRLPALGAASSQLERCAREDRRR
jgi:alkanesulfonate monooxygenase SsuD/methylene tetrahydromethanopterin reductase-like flavin-dependent oxidoreductase (luciferase family)